jgi:hypothetical protein
LGVGCSVLEGLEPVRTVSGSWLATSLGESDNDFERKLGTNESSDTNYEAFVANGLSGPHANFNVFVEANLLDSNMLLSQKVSANYETLVVNGLPGFEKTEGSIMPVLVDSKRSLTKPIVDYNDPNEASLKNHIFTHHNKDNYEVLLATAIVLVQDKKKNWKACRALLDSASQSNFVTKKFQQSLRLSKVGTLIKITGINENESVIDGKINAKVKSRVGNYEKELEFLITPSITDHLPGSNFKDICIDNTNLNLADPKFYERGKIDMLLGAEIFFEILEHDQICATSSAPLFHKTKFGWIASGKIYQNNRFDHLNTKVDDHVFVNVDLEKQLEQMWSLDTCYYKKAQLSAEEKLCEKEFVTNTKRDKHGRFIVKYPLKDTRNLLGDSYWIALKRLQYLMKKLEKNPELKKAYTAFLQEYKDLGHLEEVVDNSETDPTRVQYIPHHCIIRESSSTTKLRVVFDGSAKTKSGISLNDTQMVGAKQQKDLFEILIRFCNHKFAMTSDIEKMYRQIQMHKDHCDLQRILWIEDDQLKKYRLLTVTYGTTSASFEATRCLKELAIIEKFNLPIASDVALKDFYMDDLLTGSDTIEEAIELQKEIIEYCLAPVSNCTNGVPIIHKS